MSRILLVDDEDGVRVAYARILVGKGHDVMTASNGIEAVDKLKAGVFDVIVSDVSMPGMNGIDLLRSVRKYDLDVPVILVTGGPDLDTAMRAVEYGAFRYLSKPVMPQILLEAVEHAVRLHMVAKLKRQALELVESTGQNLGDRASMESRFNMAMASMWIAFQPILSWTARKTIGFEGLLRTAEPTLARPDNFLAVAERLGKLHELGRAARGALAAQASTAPEDALFFVNIHPLDLQDDELYSPSAPLSQIATRCIIEITERAALDGMKDLRNRVAALRRLGFRIAIDDLGAGYAGLTSLALLEPEVVKIDMSLVRGVEAAPAKQRIIRSITSLCEEMNMWVVVEGIETAGERDVVLSLGCQLLQGFLFAKPERGFQPVTY